MTENCGMSRAVSFPNFFHSLLDFHHIDDFNAFDDDFTLSNDDNCERLKKDTVDSNNNNNNSNDNRSRHLVVKADSTAVLTRCDTWAAFTSVEDTLDVSVDEHDIANTADKLKTFTQNTVSADVSFSVADKSISTDSAKATDGSCSANLPALRQLVPSEITPVQARSAIISTLASRYNKSPSSSASETVQNDRVAHDGVMNDISRREPKRGILGLASRLNVSPRELNMMSPSSF